MFYLLSIKHSNGDSLVWWRPNDKGYTSFLEYAGKYTQKQIDAKPKHYDNGHGSRPVPCEVAESLSHQVVNAEHLHRFRPSTKLRM